MSCGQLKDMLLDCNIVPTDLNGSSLHLMSTFVDFLHEKVEILKNLCKGELPRLFGLFIMLGNLLVCNFEGQIF